MLPTEPKVDIRIQRTKEWLYEALIILSKEMDYQQISVSKLTKKAGVARQTFYRNYHSIDDIITEKHQRIFSNAKEMMNHNVSLKELISYAFDMWNENKELFLLFQRAKLMPEFLGIGKERIAYILRKYKPHLSDTELRFMASFLSGAIFMTINEWLNHPSKLDKEEVKSMLLQYAESALNYGAHHPPAS